MCILSPVRSFAIFGGSYAQIPYLIKILSENYKRYRQLRKMIDDSKENKKFLRALNAGLENSVGLLEALPVKDERVLADLRTFSKAYRNISKVYGRVPKSKDAMMQVLHDQTVAESIRMVNSFKKYSKKQEENSNALKITSRQASPKGAARMAAEGNALILNSMSQLIRLQSQRLKVESEMLALKNKESKARSLAHNDVRDNFQTGFKNFEFSKTMPRF